MKNTIKILSFFAFALVITLSSCNKENESSSMKDSSDETSLDYAISNPESNILIKGDGSLEKVITKPLIKLEDCKFIVEGIIEYRLNGEVLAIVDYGNGECDNIATKTAHGETHEFKLDGKSGKKWEFEKVVVEPLVKIEGCDYIVSGIIEFSKKGTWVATIDFGDGECDEFATKVWKGGSVVFSMKK